MLKNQKDVTDILIPRVIKKNVQYKNILTTK